jgi:hypothetical protein
MFIMLGIASAILSFTIVSTVSSIKRMLYQGRVINARVDAEKLLKTNLGAVSELVKSYESFDSAKESVIGTADKNSKIVLDALPSKYDYPAITASVEKIVNLTGGISGYSVVGTDLEATAQQSSINPEPVEIPLTIAGKASYENIQKLINNLQLSIRPFKVTKLTFSGDQKDMTFNITTTTYYMPEKNLEIPLKEIK